MRLININNYIDKVILKLILTWLVRLIDTTSFILTWVMRLINTNIDTNIDIDLLILILIDVVYATY